VVIVIRTERHVDVVGHHFFVDSDLCFHTDLDFDHVLGHDCVIDLDPDHDIDLDVDLDISNPIL
jgi:hypothetical protein